jgi:hypothetical protein
VIDRTRKEQHDAACAFLARTQGTPPRKPWDHQQLPKEKGGDDAHSLITRLMTGLLCLLCAVALATAFVVAAHAEPGLQSTLTAISGQGTGHVDVSPTADDQHHTAFIAQGTAEIHDALADTTYAVQRSGDPVPDGVYAISP